MASIAEEAVRWPLVKNLFALEKELNFDNEHIAEIEQCIRFYENAAPAIDAGGDADWEAELAEIQQQIEATRRERAAVEEQRTIVAQRLRDSREIQDALLEQLNGLEHEVRELGDEIQGLDDDSERTSSLLDKYLQINAINDAFHIWYAGPYGTINNFRLGSLAIKPIDNNEINAAFGQAALLVFVIANKIGLDFKSYSISPMGSFSRLTKADAKKTVLPLHLDSTAYLLYPKWYFNQALLGFMTCIQELGDFTGETDPTLGMPYKISLGESKIGDVSFTYAADDEAWTRAMKFMLANIKWLVAWVTKHAQASFPN